MQWLIMYTRDKKITDKFMETIKYYQSACQLMILRTLRDVRDTTITYEDICILNITHNMMWLCIKKLKKEKKGW